MESERFIKYMEEVWEGLCAPGPNGSTVISSHPDFEEQENARKVATRLFDAKRLYANRVDDMPGYCYEFPDGSRANILTDGSAIRPVKRHREYA